MEWIRILSVKSRQTEINKRHACNHSKSARILFPQIQKVGIDLGGNIEVKEMYKHEKKPLDLREKPQRVIIKRMDEKAEYFLFINWENTEFIITVNFVKYNFERVSSLYKNAIYSNAIFNSTDLVKTYDFLNSIAKIPIE